MPDEACPEKLLLLRVYERAALKLVNALTDLQQRAGTMQKAEYDIVYTELQLLKVAADNAKSFLESHVSEHDC
jgi:hypothetical protein